MGGHAMCWKMRVNYLKSLLRMAGPKGFTAQAVTLGTVELLPLQRVDGGHQQGSTDAPRHQNPAIGPIPRPRIRAKTGIAAAALPIDKERRHAIRDHRSE